ncbi:MAG: hypothetical protein RIT27_824 [Pseudomonadota bacterium]|jgi:two-component system sensor histidine kinase QseC
MKTTSLKTRLLVSLLSMILSVWLIIIFNVYYETKHEVSELFDANLAQNANIIYQLLAHEIVEHYHLTYPLKSSRSPLNYKIHYDSKVAFLVRDSMGNLIAKSNSAPLFPIPQTKEVATYQNYEVENYHWRVFTLKAPHGILQTAERRDIRGELTGEIFWQMIDTLLWSFPLLAIITYLSIHRGLKPLQKIANKIATCTPEQLQKIDIQAVPLEIKSLVDTLNNLFQQLNQTFENERRFTADAAHELRTPLAGLKIQAQIALQNQASPLGSQALQNILTGVDHAHHLVAQLLTLARIDNNQTLEIQPIDLETIAQRVINLLINQALNKQQDLGLSILTDHTQTKGNPEALEILLRNLVDNALRYTPEKGEITISIERLKSEELCLMVKDNGAGISEDKMENIFERFYRGEHQHIQGSGLGLSIVKRIAELHHLRLHFENDNGLMVTVIFPNDDA